MTKRHLYHRAPVIHFCSPHVSRGGIPPQADAHAWSRTSRALAFFLFLFLTLTFEGVAGATCVDGQRLALLHFNDFHGQLGSYTDPETRASVGGIARLAATVEKVRAEDPGRPILLLFAGDLLQGTLTSSLFLGVPDVVLFDKLGVDAAVVGNVTSRFLSGEAFRPIRGETEGGVPHKSRRTALLNLCGMRIA